MSKDEKASKTRIQHLPDGELEIGAVRYKTKLTRKFSERQGWHRPDEHLLEALIPGTIQQIMVKEGQSVEQGEPLLILEAMKMRNEILAPVSGTVEKIYVKEGEHVRKAHLMIAFS
ncbi:MAG: acetyl-CoA carboxylase biotin carboxyl carrier protein subunit [Bacteroidetes bacterium]|nr:MAG: acetyl-CoA carboxylase biotin carboxyl carrier protein subunit [Bacteroidota bacterium]